MGITSIDESEYGNPSLAIGATNDGPTVLEQTSAFTTFATGGDHVSPYLIETITDKHGNVVYQHESETTEVFSQDTAYLTLDILRDVITDGTGRSINNYLNFSADWAGKTGTSEANRDIWFIASTPTVTLSSWMGYDNYKGEHVFYDPNNQGLPTGRNLNYWSQIANKIYSINPDILGTDQTHQQPEGIVEKSVLTETGTLPGTVSFANGLSVNLNGSTRTDLFKVDGLPKKISYDFSPGATDKDLKDFWEKYLAEATANRNAAAASSASQNNATGDAADAEAAPETETNITTEETNPTTETETPPAEEPPATEE
jgi:penicillin-binding protein